MSNIPTVTFEGVLKRINESFLDEKGIQLLKTCLPLFEGTPVDSDGLQMTLIKPGEDPDFESLDGQGFRSGLNRRYSGWIGFPRSRYYSVASDRKGDDNGTLKNELLYYSKNFENGTFLIDDTGFWSILRDHRDPKAADAVGLFVFTLFDLEERRNKFLEELDEFTPSRRSQDEFDIFHVGIPYEILPVRIGGVFDLRVPACRDYLVGLLNNSDPLPFKQYDYTVRQFIDCLPGLLCPDMGGNEITDEIGRHLQSQGVNGLVYPSARSDIAVDIKDGQVAGSQGWNFVDFRDLNPAPYLAIIDGRMKDLLEFKADLRYSEVTSGPTKGSFRLLGLERRYRRFYRRTLSRENRSYLAQSINSFLKRMRPIRRD